MSLIGPRPLLPEDQPSNISVRLSIRPGITGWAQIHGRNNISWNEKFRLDVWYVDNIEFALDMKITASTAWKVVKRDGINQQGEATAAPFKG